MNELCMIIKDTVRPNFLNIRTSIQTYDRDALCIHIYSICAFFQNLHQSVVRIRMIVMVIYAVSFFVMMSI